MLKPASNDPNKSKELQRFKNNPQDFGPIAIDPATVKHPEMQTRTLVADRELEKVQKEADADVKEQWKEFLDSSVNDLLPTIPDMEDDQLVVMRDVEAAGKNRKSLIDAIDAELENRKGE